MSESLWAGFHPLLPGRIHLYCPRCGRKMSNVFRSKFDPPRATLVHIVCERCGSGDKDDSGIFFDARGREISWTKGIKP